MGTGNNLRNETTGTASNTDRITTLEAQGGAVAAAAITLMRLSSRLCSQTVTAGTRRAARPAQATMLIDSLALLEGKRIVLASASPRRRELLSQVGLKFEVGAAGSI